MVKIFFLSFLIFPSLSFGAEISFFFQPYDEAGTPCVFKPSGQPHGYIATCGSRRFRIHHFSRLFQNSSGKAWEVLYWVSKYDANGADSQSVGTALTINASTASQMGVLKLSQAVENDTATLDITIPLDN